MNILIIEDQEATRDALVALLRGKCDYSVTAAVDSAEEALELLSDSRPDVIIHDLGLPGLSGADAVRATKAACPSAEILVFTVLDQDDQVFAALKAGASGYLLKDAEPSQLLASLEELRAGGSPMSFTIARKVLKEFQAIPAQEDLRETLSPLSRREEELLNLLYRGDSYREIAEKLGVSPHTVGTHIKNIYAKLHVNSRAQAVFEACSRRIIAR